MSVFWSKKVPENAIFACYPFGQFEKTIFTQRIFDLPPPMIVKAITKAYFPEKKQWVENIYKTLNNKNLRKSVLARLCMIECEIKPDPLRITSALLSKAKNSIVFCFMNKNMAFLGATPELLFSRQGKIIVCEALAGTAPIGSELKSIKTTREILPVIDYIQEGLSPFCTSPLKISPIHTRTTSNVEHLCATLQGTLKDSVTDQQIIEQLHPTPALCGVPKQVAMDWIKTCEPFERGLYGGIIGWSTPFESEWAVGIRSCLVEGYTVKLFTGAGIVSGSNPDDEWEELNHKMDLYRDIFI